MITYSYDPQNRNINKIYIMIPSSNPQFYTQASPTVRLAHVKQSMDDLHHLIEQTRSIINSRQNNIYHTPQPNYMVSDKKNYNNQMTATTKPRIQIRTLTEGDETPNSRYHIKIKDQQARSNVKIDLQIVPNRQTHPTYHSGQMISDRYQYQQYSQSYVQPSYNNTHSHNHTSNINPSKLKTQKRQQTFQYVRPFEPSLHHSPSFAKQIKIREQSKKSSQINQEDQEIMNQQDFVIHQSNYKVHPQFSAYIHRKYNQFPSQNYRYRTAHNNSLHRQIPEQSINRNKFIITDKQSNNYVTPKNYQKRLQNNLLTPSPNTHHINLSRRTKTYHQTSDLTNRTMYSNRLKKIPRTNTNNNRSYSGKKVYQTSPQIQRITNRLYYSRINKQPCLKFEREQSIDKMNKIHKICQSHEFIRKYLSDREIYDIMGELEADRIPEDKWPDEMINVINSKLKYCEFRY